MAQHTRTLTEYVDDIEDKRFSEGDGETLAFGFEGKSYVIDLNAKNAEKMCKAFRFYVERARPVSSSSPSPSRGRVPAARANSGGRDYDLADLRRWAAVNGIELPVRGRTKGEIIEQYKAGRQ